MNAIPKITNPFTPDTVPSAISVPKLEAYRFENRAECGNLTYIMTPVRDK
jgi:hypothetical protein